jgi:putative membrane protein
MDRDAIPYCGAPPEPGSLALNADPLLIAVLVALLALGWRGGGQRPALLAGMAVLAVALLSPLCGLAVALFSARVGQHVLIILGAAPLLALALRWRAPSAPVAAALFAGVLWAWHLPGPYGWTFVSHLGWWVMHASLLLASIWLWQSLERARIEAALLTFAPRALFWPHATTTLPWGMTALEDQQLGGLLMWVPGGVLFAAAALAGVARLLRETRPAA